MLAISVWQPWASLLICRAKFNETRHWPLPPRADVQYIIHASKKLVRDVEPEVADICEREFGAQWRASLPRGALIGSIYFLGCTKVDQAFRDSLTTQEYALGNYHGDAQHPDRYAWKGEMPEAWEPITYRGQQGFFPIPTGVIVHARKLEKAA